MITTKTSKEQSLSGATKSLMHKEPFYGIFLLMLNKNWSETLVPTAGVSRQGINYQLTINPVFWDGLVHDHKRGLLKHELLHIVFFHVLEDPKLYESPEILNIAMDIEINQYIDTADLPPGAMLPTTYPEIKLDLKAGFRYYYQELLKAYKSNSCQSLKDDVDAMKKSMAGRGTYGKGGSLLPDHSTWKGFDKLSDTEKSLIKRQIDYQLSEVATQIQKSRGYIPGELAEYLKNLNYKEPPKFDWKSYLRRFAGGSSEIYTKKLRRKYNKRFEDNPGLKIKQRRHILVAVDTSGSVSSKELEEFFHEIAHINKTGTEVTVLQADAQISHIGKYKRNMEIKVHGRGGTDFQPACDYYAKNLNKFTAMIYFTDGECSIPQVAFRSKLLWVLSSTSGENKNLPGKVIKLN